MVSVSLYVYLWSLILNSVSFMFYLFYIFIIYYIPNIMGNKNVFYISYYLFCSLLFKSACMVFCVLFLIGFYVLFWYLFRLYSLKIVYLHCFYHLFITLNIIYSSVLHCIPGLVNPRNVIYDTISVFILLFIYLLSIKMPYICCYVLIYVHLSAFFHLSRAKKKKCVCFMFIAMCVDAQIVIIL